MQWAALFAAGLLGGLVAAALASRAWFLRAQAAKLAAVKKAASEGSGHSYSLSALVKCGDLPEPVLRFLLFSLGQASGRLPRSACVQWRGHHRLSPASPRWNDIEGEMHVCMAGRPSFVWVGRIQLAPLVWLEGWEAYAGAGSVQWWLWGVVPLVRREGGELDRSGAVRYLAEAPAFPMGLLPSRFLSWEAVPGEGDCARAVIRDGGVAASAVFTFDPEGRVQQVRSTDTVRATAGGALVPTPFLARYSGHQRFHDGSFLTGVATEGELHFETPEGDFAYGSFSLVSLQYGA